LYSSFRLLINELSCNLLNTLPSTLHMLMLGMCLADTQAQRITVVEPGVCEKQLSALIEALKQGLVDCISASVSKAN
jgi:hypothetical protein